jgi:DNA repair protein RecO (recombination protein O)
MPAAQSSRIIVLHLTKYGDSSLVVHAIDSLSGRCSYLLRGAGRSKRVSMGALHNLAVLDIVSVPNPKSSLSYLKEYEPALQLNSLRSDINKSSIALFISELLYRTIVEQNCDERLFGWLCDAIGRLDAAEGSVANFHLWFLAGLCTVLGFGPTPSGDFDGADLLHGDNLALLRELTAAEFTQAMAIPLNGARRRDFCERMIRYISFHLGINLNLRSLDVLHELYA